MRAFATPKLIVWSALALLAVGTDCRRGSTSARPEPMPVSKEALSERMHSHFAAVHQIKSAVVEGDLDSTRELADAFVEEHGTDVYPLAWRPYVVQMLAHAEGVAAARDRATAADQAAKLSAQCGRCHHALEARPRFRDAIEPPEEDGIARTMERHAYATDRMWEGIVAPSDADWDRGLAIFLAYPECPGDARQQAGEYQRASCDRLHVLSERAARTSTFDERVQLYGDVLETCAGCHRAYESAYQASAGAGF